jgi:hypothetical protein
MQNFDNKKLTIWDKFIIKHEELTSAKKAKLKKETLVEIIVNKLKSRRRVS